MKLLVTCSWILSLCCSLALSSLGAGQPGAGIEVREFAPASQAPGPTLFTRMPAEATGLVVRNGYDDPQMWGRRYREFMGGAMGSGVAAGDYDGDGQVDLYVSTKTRPGRLFRNRGGWKFEDVTAKAGLSEEGTLLTRLRSAIGKEAAVVWHQGAVFADVNNDGALDLYVCRSAAPNLLFVNQRDGTFREESAKRGLNLVDGSVVGAFADYDRDGWLDVLVLTNQMDGTEPQGRPDRLFRNLGQGFFQDVTDAAGISGPTFGHAATWFDYDNDGWPDLYICNDFAGADHLYRNNQNGTFSHVLDQIVPHTPYSSMGADAADINNDGHLDLLVADMAPTTREKDRRGLAASRNDVVLMSAKNGAAPQYMRNALLLNTGRGGFVEAACWAGLEATDWTWSVRFEDFDQDGWVDLHVTNGMVREANNSDVLARMMRALSDEERIRAMKNSPVLAEANLAYRNDPARGFVQATQEWGLGEVGVSFGAATADLDNDGDLDLVYINYDGGVSAFRNDATGHHRVQFRLRGQKSNRFGVGAKVQVETASGIQVRELIVSRGYASGSEIVAHFGLGGDAEVRRLAIQWPSGSRQVAEHLPANQAYIVSESTQSEQIDTPAERRLFQPNGREAGLSLVDASRPALAEKEHAFLPFRTDRRGPALAIADLDGDGNDEILMGRTTGSPRRLLRKTGDQYAECKLAGLDEAGIEDGPVLIFDADGDGRRDILVTKASAEARAWPQSFVPLLYLNRGDMTFVASQAFPTTAIHVGAACAADIDADGDLDVFLGSRGLPGKYPETSASGLFRNDGGRFTDVSDSNPELRLGGPVKSAVFSDVDLDGRPDLIVAGEWTPVRCFKNEGKGVFRNVTNPLGFGSGGKGWWNSLAAADLNGDGRQDFVAGNLGFNTTYRATAHEPVVLLQGKFGTTGTPLLMETVWDRGELYPLRGKTDLAARIPALVKKYPSNDDFARANLRQLFGDTAVEGAQRYDADNFASGVFLSQQDGSYRFEPLPREAQLGPIRGLIAADLDGDGLTDICASQNDDGAVPRFHGAVGVFLKGNGKGRFTVLPPGTSGLVLPGTGGALAAFNTTGNASPDLFTTRHGGASELWMNMSETQWTVIKLRGPVGNADAVGARVQLAYSTGDVTHLEIGLGGGWLTQFSSAIYAPSSSDRRLSGVRVTWPTGQTTEHKPDPASALLELSP